MSGDLGAGKGGSSADAWKWTKGWMVLSGTCWGLSHVGTDLCLWPHHGHVPATCGGCELQQLPCFRTAPMFSENEMVAPSRKQCWAFSGEGRTLSAATCRVGMQALEIQEAVSQSHSDPWVPAFLSAVVVFSRQWFSPMGGRCTCPHLSDNSQGHWKTSKSPNMKAARQTTEQGGGLLHPSSDQSCAPWVEGSQLHSKVGATRGLWYSGWGQGLKSRTRSLGSYYAHFTWTVSRHWCLQPRWRIHA